MHVSKLCPGLCQYSDLNMAYGRDRGGAGVNIHSFLLGRWVVVVGWYGARWGFLTFVFRRFVRRFAFIAVKHPRKSPWLAPVQFGA